jgi:hypothetical protein
MKTTEQTFAEAAMSIDGIRVLIDKAYKSADEWSNAEHVAVARLFKEAVRTLKFPQVNIWQFLHDDRTYYYVVCDGHSHPESEHLFEVSGGRV